MGRLLISLIVGGALFAFVAYQMGILGTEDDPTPTNGATATAKELKLGDWLYEPKAVAPVPRGESKVKLRDPVVVTAHMQIMDKLEVSIPLPGKLLFIGAEVPEALPQAVGPMAFVLPPFENNSIPGVKEDTVFVYRRLYEDKFVTVKEMVAKMDVTKVRSELALKTAKVKVAGAQVRAADAAEKEALERYIRAQDLFRRGVIAAEDLGSAKLTYVKFQEEHETKQKEMEQAVVEMDQMQILYNQHDIRNDLGVMRGLVQKIYKSRGEVVKDQEPILLLHNLDRLMAEALVEPQYRDRLSVGKKVLVEPVIEQAPVRSFKGHRAEITAVAIAHDKDYPRIVSASEDKTVCVWDYFSKSPILELPHGAPVRALALSRDGLILTGTSDGTIFLWELNSGKLIKSIPKAHRDAITSVAFSPTGEYFASGSASAQLTIWDTAKAERLYSLDADHMIGEPHRGAITALTFTDPGVLISAARDNSVRLWELKKLGAKLKGQPITGRSGGIAQLGVSPDGRLMFLDRGKELQILSAADGSRYATMDNPSGLPFETLALFSPGNGLVLTGGAVEGRLQLWRAPTEKERAREVRQWVTLERSPVTCAAFSPLAHLGGDHAVAVSGTRDGYLYLWELPSVKDLEDHGVYATISLVANSLDSASRQLRLGVEVPNPTSPAFPEGRFTPGRAVSIVIE